MLHSLIYFCWTHKKTSELLPGRDKEKKYVSAFTFCYLHLVIRDPVSGVYIMYGSII